MIKRVYNVKSIILVNSVEEKKLANFEKLLLYKESCFISFYFDKQSYLFKVNLIEERVYLDPVTEEELILLSQMLPMDIMKYYERLWAVGISYNEISSQDYSSVKFRISNDDQPLDILPYLLQTGEQSIEFSD